jgi:hypothetical protein
MAKKYDLMKTLVDGLAVTGGFVAGKAVSKLPFIKDQNNLVRAGAKVALGFLGPRFIKNDLVEKVGVGLMVNGLHDAVTEFIPAIAGIPFAKPVLLPNASMGALEAQGLGALEDDAALGSPGRATL